MSRVLRQRGRDPQQQGLTITSEACPGCLLSSVRSRLIKLPQVFQKAPATIWLPSNQTQELVGDRSLSDLRRVLVFLWGYFPILAGRLSFLHSTLLKLYRFSEHLGKILWLEICFQEVFNYKSVLFISYLGLYFFFTTFLATIYCCINFTNV